MILVSVNYDNPGKSLMDRASSYQSKKLKHWLKRHRRPLVETVQMLTDVTEQNPAWIRGAVMRNEQIWPHSWKTAEVSSQIIVDRLFIPWKISKSSEKNPTLIVSGLHLRRAGEGKESWYRNVLTEIFCYTVLYSLGWLLTDFIVSFMCLFVCLFYCLFILVCDFCIIKIVLKK